MALLRAFATVGGYTGLSRILGLARDILIASVLGTGPLADAFFVAFRLPNMFRRLFAEGAFNAAFVPLFARRMEEEGRAAAQAFAEETLAVMVAGLFALSALAMAAMPWLLYLLAFGFAVDDPAKYDAAVALSRITFPYLLFIALAAMLSGVLNALYRFSAAAAAPILLNLMFIAALTIVVPLTGHPALVLAWTVALAGVAQFLVLLVAAQRAGMAFRLPRPRLTPGVRRVMTLMGPGLLSAGALQVNLTIGTVIASFQAGAVSYLYYADRIYQLPLGLIGIALGVVLLPDLSRKLRGGAAAAAMESLNRGLELALLFTLPATVALLAIPGPIVIVLFEHQVFDRAASEATAQALTAYALGLPAYVLVKILQPAFFAREDTVTPLRMAVISVIANIVLSLALFLPLGHVGLALATALSAWLHVLLLGRRLRADRLIELDARFRARLPRIGLASLALGLALWGAARQLSEWFDAGFVEGLLALAGLVGGGLLLYFAGAFLVGAFSRDDLALLFRRAGSASR